MIAALLLALGCATAAAAGQAPAPPAPERLVDVLVHGNHTTPDADVIAIAGLEVGAPLAPDAIAAATKRLESADRFEASTSASAIDRSSASTRSCWSS